jgi:hypothetical protein
MAFLLAGMIPTLRVTVRITRKFGRFLPKVWPHKKILASPPCKAVYVAWQRQGRYLRSSAIFVTRMALQANLPRRPNFRVIRTRFHPSGQFSVTFGVIYQIRRRETGENIDSRLFLFDSRRDRRAKFQGEKNSDLAQKTAISCGGK